MRYWIPIIIVLTLLLSQTTATVQACSPIFQTNYWYRLDSEIDTSALPPNVTATVEHPPYSEESHAAILGQFTLTNRNDTPLYIIPGDVLYNLEVHKDNITKHPEFSHSQEIVDFAEQLSQETISDLSLFDDNPYFVVLSGASKEYVPLDYFPHVIDNPESPAGADTPPPPTSYELGFILDNKLYLVPVTVNYSPNVYYDENHIVYNAPATDYLIKSDAVVKGQVISGANTDGYVRVHVDQWLLGEGSDEIEMGYFENSGTSCDTFIAMNRQAYFLLTKSMEPDSNRYNLTYGSDRRNNALNITQENATMLIDALWEIKGVSVDDIERLANPIELKEPLNNQAEPEISPTDSEPIPFTSTLILSSVAGLLLLGLGIIWYKKD